MSETEHTADLRVAIVEDNREVRQSMEILLNGTPGFRCVATAGKGGEAIATFPVARPDIILMDIRMPGMTGIECVRKYKQLVPQQKILMLTTYEEEDYLFQSLQAGAIGYILKRTPPVQIIEHIRQAHEGASPLSGKMARKLVQYFQQTQPVSNETEKLSERERETLGALADGLRNKEIADRLHVSESTVRTHLRNIYEKLHVQSRSEAVAKYLKGNQR